MVKKKRKKIWRGRTRCEESGSRMFVYSGSQNEDEGGVARWPRSIFPSQSPANLEVCGGNEEGWQIKAAGVRFRAAVNI